MNESVACTRAWLELFRKVGHVFQTPRPSNDALHRSKQYLEQALVILMENQDSWNEPPVALYPPVFPDGPPTDYFLDEEANTGTPMVNRRLLIRLVTLQSEILACEATQCRFMDPPRWLQGVDLYENSLERLNFGMYLADSEYARLKQENEHAESVMAEDASIVQVANGRLIQQRDMYRKAAETAARKIRSVLEPQWQSRNEVKNKMGDRWYNNPSPKLDHWHMREEDEMRLKEIERAIQRLDALDIRHYQMNQQVENDDTFRNNEKVHPAPKTDRRLKIRNCQGCQRFGHYH